MADFPNVPIAPGVPPLPRDPFAVPEVIQLLSRDAITDFNVTAWGVFLNGARVGHARTVGSFEFKRDWAIADYPIENGGFQSYDKVNVPFTARVQLASGGSEANRAELLNQVAAIADTLKLYDVVTPEQVYTDVNVMRYDLRRTARDGVGLIAIDLWLLEVRITAARNGNNTRSASASNVQNDGNVQPSADVPPTRGSVEFLQNGTAPGGVPPSENLPVK